ASPKINFPTIRRFTLSCTNVSFMPRSFAPPQPKHLFVGFGANVIVSVKFSQPLRFSLYLITSLLHCFFLSNQRDATSLRAPHAALALAHLHSQEIRQSSNAASDLLFIQAGVSETQRVGQRILYVEVAARCEEYSALFRVDQ